MKIALIACTKTKRRYSCPAKELYRLSELFALSYEYAKLHADRIFILSSKYGLISDEEVIQPYELSIKQLSLGEVQIWADGVILSLKKKFNMENTEFIILAGKDYYQPILRALPHYKLPMSGKDYQTKIDWLQDELAKNLYPGSARTAITRKPELLSVNNDASTLHRAFTGTRLYMGSEIRQIPFNNGIYILFENGEFFQDFPRIVRVGTHTSPDRLRGRLSDHFFRENKDGSIFRKNIGKAQLRGNMDPYLKIWSLDTSKPENLKYIEPEKQKALEHEVTQYINQNIRIAVIPVERLTHRTRLEEGIIATLHADLGFQASRSWLGRYSPEAEIRSSGLWLKDGLNGTPLNQEELALILRLIPASPVRSTMLTHTIPSIQAARTVNPHNYSSVQPFRPVVMPLAVEDNKIISQVKEFILDQLDELSAKHHKNTVMTARSIQINLKGAASLPLIIRAMEQMMRSEDEVLQREPFNLFTVKYRL